MAHTLRNAAASAIVVTAAIAGNALSGGGVAAAAPTFVGPLYYEVTPSDLFEGPVQCRDAVDAERAAGNIILIDCLPINNPSAPILLLSPAALRVGIVLGGS